jgi:hypothetical protein
MRSTWLGIVVAAALLPALASARAWKGIVPGMTSEAQVIEKFGEPTRKTTRSGRTVLVYFGEEALEGTRQAQFHVDARGVVAEITIFLSASLDAESIEGTYGKPARRTFSEDTFQKMWVYPAAGVTVYFNKEGSVEALMFGPGTKGPSRAGAGGREEASAPRQTPAPQQR